MALEYIDRPPRIQPELPIEEIEIPEAPDEQPRAGQDLITVLLPMVSILGFVLVSASGNPLFILPIGLTVVLTVVVVMFRNRKEKKELEKKKRAYAEMLAEKRQEMTRAHSAQRIFYHHNYPDVATLYEIASRKESSRFGSRLWERRTTDVDFGVPNCSRRMHIYKNLGGPSGGSRVIEEQTTGENYVRAKTPSCGKLENV